MQYIEIRTKQNDTEGSVFLEVSIDGHCIHGVRSLNLEKESINDIPKLTLQLNALNVSVDGVALIHSKEMMQEMEIIFKEPS